MKTKKLIFSLCFVSFLAALAPAQSFKLSPLSSTENSQQESQSDSWSQQKHPVAGITGALGFNLLLATWNRYMIGSGWAKTGPEQWNHFWERPLTWDNDWYWTNYFLHPYQGSMYYMSSRGANLNPLESMGITILGSAFWEYLCETNDPSKNDMIYTTVGSFCVGEMFFRLSQEADSISKLLGVAINPQRLWTEYVWQIKQKNTGGNIHKAALALTLGNITAGTDVKNINTGYENQEIYPVAGGLEFAVDYKDPYSHDSNMPYSQFSLFVSGSMGKGSGHAGPCAYENYDEKLFYDIRIFSDAMLFARAVNAGQSADTTVGITMIYDFDWHSYYMLSSLAPGFALKQRVNGTGGSFEWQAQLAGILLGTTDYFYHHRAVITLPDGVFRTYSDTIGAQTILKAKYNWEKGAVISADFRGYAMYDFYDQRISGADTGWEYIGILSASVELPVSKKVRIGLKDELYGKAALYRNMNDVYQLINTSKVYAKLQLK